MLFIPDMGGSVLQEGSNLQRSNIHICFCVSMAIVTASRLTRNFEAMSGRYTGLHQWSISGPSVVQPARLKLEPPSEQLQHQFRSIRHPKRPPINSHTSLMSRPPVLTGTSSRDLLNGIMIISQSHRNNVLPRLKRRRSRLFHTEVRQRSGRDKENLDR